MRNCFQPKHQFCNTKTHKLSNFGTSKLDIQHFNIWSLKRNCDNRQNYLTTYNFCLSVTVLSEPWQNGSRIMEKAGAAVLPFLFTILWMLSTKNVIQNPVLATFLFEYKLAHKLYQSMCFPTPHQIHLLPLYLYRTFKIVAWVIWHWKASVYRWWY